MKNYKDYKYFENRPDVVKVFDDLDAWLDHCRFNLINFDPKDLYRSDAYKDWNRRKNNKSRNYKGDNYRSDYNRSGNNRKFQRQ